MKMNLLNFDIDGYTIDRGDTAMNKEQLRNKVETYIDSIFAKTFSQNEISDIDNLMALCIEKANQFVFAPEKSNIVADRTQNPALRLMFKLLSPSNGNQNHEANLKNLLGVRKAVIKLYELNKKK